MTSVIYHSTPVTSFNEKRIVLDTGGWSTNTTKERMNEASSEYNLGYTVYQKKFKWYAQYRGKDIPFVGDTLVLER